MDEHFTIFTKEALQGQDGKKVPLKDRPGGRTIGEATMRYDEETGNLNAELKVDDEKFKEFLEGPMPMKNVSLGPIFRDYKKKES